ncbi:MAG: Gfo/Idh/MocA family oxidoreductase [Planctomycetes bacterium]|nr:Gfo/Idh/MocA family oxidoreductase [Planctomycetota bacterium]
MKNLRFACIGCGEMGALHVLNAKAIPGVEVVAYADVRPGQAEKFLEQYGGDYATTDPARIFADPRIDGVLIQTGPKHHPALGIAAAKAGKHIFMEKPVALTVEDALELERAVAASGVRFLVGFCNRLAPAVVRAKRLVPKPWITVGQCADSIVHQACHNLDLIVHCFHEAPLVSVYASGGTYYGLEADAHLPADSFIATLGFADGSQASYVQHGKGYNALMGKYSFQLFGKDRCAYIAKRFKECHLSTGLGGVDHSHVFTGPDFSPTDAAKHEQNVRGPHGYMGHFEELAALCASIRDGSEPPMTIAHGRHVLQVEAAIMASLSTKAVIDYPAFLSKWKTPQPAKAARAAVSAS